MRLLRLQSMEAANLTFCNTCFLSPKRAVSNSFFPVITSLQQREFLESAKVRPTSNDVSGSTPAFDAQSAQLRTIVLHSAATASPVGELRAKRKPSQKIRISGESRWHSTERQSLAESPQLPPRITQYLPSFIGCGPSCSPSRCQAQTPTRR